MTKELKTIIDRTIEIFPKSYINRNDELIFEPKNNVYFRLENIKDELDFKCKVFAWLSRPISKGLNNYWSKKVLTSVNELLGTNFTKEDMRKIYTYLGNDENRDLCVKFIESNYNLALLD